MAHVRLGRTVLAGMLVAVWLGSSERVFAQGPGSTPLVSSSDPAAQDADDGVDNAREAGIYVDPAAAQLMEDAPVGTCANDPTLGKCDPVHAVVYATPWNPLEDPVASASKRKRGKRIIARASQTLNCAIKVIDRPSPYKASGYAQMDGQHACFQTQYVADVDIYLYLRKAYRGEWYTMDNRWFYNVSPAWWSGSKRTLCDGSPYRNWRAAANAYTLQQGVMYAAHQHHDNWIDCG